MGELDELGGLRETFVYVDNMAVYRQGKMRHDVHLSDSRKPLINIA